MLLLHLGPFRVPLETTSSLFGQERQPLPLLAIKLSTVIYNNDATVLFNEDARQKAASTTHRGFEFKRQPCKLCNAPATLQRLMQLV